MIIIPAIDILGGECVRLYKGDYSTAGRVADDIMTTVKRFADEGAGYIHTVDLDGAKQGKRVNDSIIIKIAAAVSVPVEVGGGIRTIDDIDFYISKGLSRVILGSAAYRSPELVREAVKRYGSAIAVGIDARNGYVATEGWTETSETGYIEFAALMKDCGVENIIVTDIARDGTLGGANTDMLAELKNMVDIKITASGGVRDIDDIRRLASLKLYAAIAGKAIYSGTLSLRDAIEAAKR